MRYWKSMVFGLWGVAVADLAVIDSARAQCTGNETLRVTCDDSDDDDRHRIRVRVKNGEPGETLTIRVTNDDGYEQDFSVTVNKRGKAKLNVRVPGDDDDYTVTLIECDVSGRVECDG